MVAGHRPSGWKPVKVGHLLPRALPNPTLGCPHAKAVNKLNRVEASASSEAAAAAQEALRFGPNGVLNEIGDPLPVKPAAAGLTAPAVPPPPLLPRRALHMFPCAQEVALCDAYCTFLDQGLSGYGFWAVIRYGYTPILRI